MIKCYTAVFSKFLLGLTVVLFTATGLNAQTVVINTGAAGAPAYNAGPIYRSTAGSAYDASRYTYLYTSDELAAAGITTGSTISVVGWTKANDAVSTGGGIFRIYMKNSTATSFSQATIPWTDLSAGTTMVYENLSFTVPATVSPNYITFNLSNPFTYTGGSLEISTEWDINQVSGNPTTGTFDWLWSTVTDRIYGTGETVLANATTLSSTSNSISDINDRRPFIQITYTPGGPCTDPPVPGTITSSASSVCLGVPFTISSAGGTSGTGQTYQWQISSDNIAWSDITGATSLTLNATQSATNYYRLQVTCGATTVSTNVVMVNTPAAIAGTYTINNNAPGSATNFVSFNAAYDFMKCGISGPVIFNVDPLSGPYNEQLIMQPVPGASAINTVTFNGNGREITYKSSVTGQRATIKLDGADHITFDSLVISATGSTTTEYGFGVHLINDADSNTFNRNRINIDSVSTSTNYAGIVISSSHTSATTTGSAMSDGNKFTNNTIVGGYYGFSFVGSTSVANQNNLIRGNRILETRQYAMYLMGNFNVVVDSNFISRPNRTSTNAFYGVYVTSLNISIHISRNTFTNAYGGNPTATTATYGIYFNAVDALGGLENKVYNNEMYNFTGNGDVYGLYNTGSDNVWFMHNTVLLDGAGGSGITRGFYQTTVAAGIRLVNNIIVITRAGSSTKYGIYYNTATSEVESNRNDIFLASPTGDQFIGFSGGAHATLADWQTATGDDLNSVTNDPMFTNAGLGNLRPTNASVDNLGGPEGITTDITGLPRSATTPDLGAYEFTPGNCVSPPTGGTAVINPNPVCENTSVQLGLADHSIGLGQTYEWQSSPNLAGPYTTFTGVLTNPNETVTSTTTLYYRAAITCSGVTAYSDPVQLIVFPALPAGTYTIDAAGTPSPTVFTSFNAAKAALECGITGPVVFEVAPNSGPYNEQLILGEINGSSAVNTVTFKGNGNTIAYSSSVTGERAVIKLRGTDHFIFDSLTIDATGTGTYGIGVHMLANADSNKFIRNTIVGNTTSTSTNFTGIAISASETSATGTGSSECDGNIIDSNYITGHYYGITCVGSSTVANRNNRITNNIISEFYTYGVYLNGNNNTLVEHNEMSRPTRANAGTFYGVYMTGVSTGVDISKNKMHTPFGGEPASTSAFYGVYMTGVDATPGFETVVSNNAIYNIINGGSHYGFYNTSSNYAHYYHNTVSLDDVASTSTSLAYGLYQTTLAEGIDIKNNIFSITRGGTGNNVGLFFATATTTFTSDYNNFYITGPDAYIGSSGGLRQTLADWQAATSGDANSLTTNPFFTSPLTGNLLPMSPVLDDQGTPGAGITTDIVDAPRSATTPDIGAWEFAVPPCTAPPVGGVANASPNTGMCMGASVLLTLNGASFGSGQTYQWQYSTSATGPWTPLGDPMMFADTLIYATSTLYYQVAVTCSGNTQFSTPTLVTVNPAFLGGVYTIDPSNPVVYPANDNFASFTTAVAELECGITDDVTFNVAPGTYTEQIRMHPIAGTSQDARVTFQSANGNPASVTLTYDATVAASNYVLLLDSASYVTYKNMTITASNTTYGRAVQLAGTASYDSLVNNIITVPAITSTSSNFIGIYADGLTGSDNVIRGNAISNGNTGIHIDGVSTAVLTKRNVIDSNTITGYYQYGIYLSMNGDVRVRKNKVTSTAPLNSTSYAIYGTNTDSAFVYSDNEVTIENTTTTSYGMYFTLADASDNARGMVTGNRITAITGNTGSIYGLYHNASDYVNTVNNVITVQSSGTTSYGLYSTGGGGTVIHNNTVVNSSTGGTTTNVAAYITQTSGALPSVNIRNNIFYHRGGGRAMYTTNVNFLYSDYNTYYTSGTALIQHGTAVYGDLQAWKDGVYWDLSSIVIEPALISQTDLRPNLTDPNVWAIHGRGVQIPGNDVDIENNPRPTTLTTGVPDMGAYEFFPTVEPPALTAIPATPAPGITQTFMFGSDTVTKITYAATAPVPASISLKRYSGVLPPGLAPGQQSMYYYIDVDVPAQGPHIYSIQNYYVDSWQGFIPTEQTIKLGRTDATNAWVVNLNSTVNHYMNYYRDQNLSHIDKFTGLTDGTVPPAVPPTFPVDSSNAGTRFWVAYGHSYDFSSNAQDMVLYLSAEQAANVTVRVNGTSWERTYAVAANTAIVSDILPKSGMIDARITDEGKFDRGISITSDVPIVAYAHIYNGSNSGAGMLLPVGVYGYEYKSLNSRQYYPTGGAGSYSWFFVIADNDSTLVEITPIVETKGGRPAGVPFQVYLNKGELYNVMGTISGAQGTDLTGSTIRSIANESGDCYPIGVFSGSSRTAICNTTNGDNMIQQVFPSQAWGTKYLTFATASTVSNTEYNSNMFRVMVKDPATNVIFNNAPVPLANLIVPGNYYEFGTPLGTGPGGAIYIEADQPIMVAQYMVSDGGTQCTGISTSGNGDPEMIYISPIEQGIKKAVFYNTDESAITANYINLVISDGGLASLTIDGNSTFTHVFPHPFLAGYSCVRHNLGGASSQHIIESDSTFTAITYGLGSVESYGYNAGTLVKNLNGIPFITNTLGSSSSSAYTCTGAPFRFSVYIPLKPTQIVWEFSNVAYLQHNTDSVQINPLPIDSIFSNGRWLYRFEIQHDFTFTLGGTYNIPIHISHPSIEGCSNVLTTTLSVVVYDAPVVDFATNFSGCYGETLQFTGSATTPTSVPVTTWDWDFGGGQTPSGQNQTFTYPAPGVYNVTLSIVTQDGCVGDTTREVTVNELPVVALVEDSVEVCGSASVTFEVENPDPAATYSWFSTETGGTPLATGVTFTTPAVTGTVRYYVEAMLGSGCISTTRSLAYATVLDELDPVIAVLDSAGPTTLKFKWDAVPGSLTYQVSTDNGVTWIDPSSGPSGLTHTVTGLLPLESVTLLVRAYGAISCQVSTSAPVTARALPADIFIPNAFTPNGDGNNDVFLIYGFTIEKLRFVVFNQWGQKLFESNNQSTGWNGTHKGKVQPSGVYMYVAEITLRDGTNMVRKGSINLVR